MICDLVCMIGIPNFVSFLSHTHALARARTHTHTHIYMYIYNALYFIYHIDSYNTKFVH